MRVARAPQEQVSAALAARAGRPRRVFLCPVIAQARSSVLVHLDGEGRGSDSMGRGRAGRTGTVQKTSPATRRSGPTARSPARASSLASKPASTVGGTSSAQSRPPERATLAGVSRTGPRGRSRVHSRAEGRGGASAGAGGTTRGGRAAWPSTSADGARERSRAQRGIARCRKARSR